LQEVILKNSFENGAVMQLYLVCCRSGRRSKIAVEALAELGYTNIKEIGGIIDWPYEVEK